MNAFEIEIRKSCKLLDIYYQKVAVAQRGKVKLKSSPYDSFILARGRFIAVELKSQKVFGSFPLANIQEHQFVGLQEVIDNGCSAYLLINQRRVEKNGKSKPNNRAWFVDYSRWGELLGKIANRKSIPADMFTNGELLTDIPRIHIGKELVWDLRDLINEKTTDDSYSDPGSVCPYSCLPKSSG